MDHSIELSEVSLHYVEQGRGEPVLLLHGFPATWYSWNPVLETLSSQYRVICPDMRGYNLSSRPAGVSAYTPDKVSGDLIELLDRLGLEKVRLVGHDWGGAIAYHLAAHYPESFSHLSVLNCPHPAALVRHLKTNFQQLKRSWYILFFQLPWIPEWLIRRNIDGFVRSAFRPQRAFSDEEREHYKRALLQPGALTATINYYRAAGRAVLSSRPKPPKISIPSQLIWGERDSALGLELTDGMERYFTAPLRKDFLPGSGHWVHHQEPEVVGELLMNFWESQ